MSKDFHDPGVHGQEWAGKMTLHYKDIWLEIVKVLEDWALEGLIHLKPTMAHNKQGQRVARQFMEADYAHNTHEKIQKVGGTGIYLGFGTDKCPLANMTGGRSG
jgi:hypothetical protein